MSSDRRCPLSGYAPELCPHCGISSNFPIEKWSPYDRGEVIGIIVGEGYFRIAVHRVNLLEDYQLPPQERIYKYNYASVGFGIDMWEPKPVRKVAEGFNLPLTTTLIYGKFPRYRADTEDVAKVVEIAEYLIPYTKDTTIGRTAQTVIEVFKDKKLIP
jgi:hypothetical protein